MRRRIRKKEINTHGHKNTKKKFLISLLLFSFKRTKNGVNFKFQCQLFLNFVILLISTLQNKYIAVPMYLSGNRNTK